MHCVALQHKINIAFGEALGAFRILLLIKRDLDPHFTCDIRMSDVRISTKSFFFLEWGRFGARVERTKNYMYFIITRFYIMIGIERCSQEQGGPRAFEKPVLHHPTSTFFLRLMFYCSYIWQDTPRKSYMQFNHSLIKFCFNRILIFFIPRHFWCYHSTRAIPRI